MEIAVYYLSLLGIETPDGEMNIAFNHGGCSVLLCVIDAMEYNSINEVLQRWYFCEPLTLLALTVFKYVPIV